MLGWFRRKKQLQTEASEAMDWVAEVRRMLDCQAEQRATQEAASRIAKAFARTYAESKERVLDAKKLPYPKEAIRQAFELRIRFFEECCRQEPDAREWTEDLELHRAFKLRISDFQEIDSEDAQVVEDANEGRLNDYDLLLLIHKYHQRAMRENGCSVPDPIEPDGQRVSFEEVRRRFEEPRRRFIEELQRRRSQEAKHH